MSYLYERAAEAHRDELLRVAQRERQARVYVGQRYSVRRPIGRFLVRVGQRLHAEPRQAQHLASAGESG